MLHFSERIRLAKLIKESTNNFQEAITLTALYEEKQTLERFEFCSRLLTKKNYKKQIRCTHQNKYIMAYYYKEDNK